jgi:chromosome segregation protein
LDLQEQQLSLDLDDLLKKVGGLGRAKQEADEKVREIQSKRELIAAEAEERADKVRKARVRSEEVQRELHGLEVTQAQYEVETRTIEEKLQVEYKVDLEAPPVALEADFDADSAERECIELRAKIERLGLVNMVAVEEYDELSQRYKFLSEQRDDLLKAKDDLQKAIHKINLTSKELFASTFATVQENFKDIFQRLFEGGRAELILIDEGDVLESGIEIVARPPGKRLQSVSLLSGGEKALTAIALLFALFMVKPSPFCLLDEIDAPLDDVNVGRFTHLLKEFAKRTQFIMITHNKVSMETADVMYGVTMQESGVSKIISTRFREGSPKGSAV